MANGQGWPPRFRSGTMGGKDGLGYAVPTITSPYLTALQRATNMHRIGQAVEAARVLIENEYAPPVVPMKATWDHAVERLTARLKTSGNRESTLGYYLKLIRLVRAGLPKTEGPADVTPASAAAWRDKVIATPGRRKILPSAHYVAR